MRNYRTKRLFPWKEGLSRRRITNLPPRPLAHCQVRSRPKSSGQDQLEIYLKSMEKQRFSTLGEAFGRLLKDAADRWNLADSQMKALQQKQAGLHNGGTARQGRAVDRPARRIGRQAYGQ